ncbi:UNVERIFIED_CONTAM: hypothetical protein FKN15_034526 [Acipenser sinensis]
MRRSGSACNTSTLPNMQKLREPTGFKSRDQGFSSFQPWKKGSVQPMPLLSTKLIMEETRSLKIDKKKPISSNLSKGIMTILENTSDVRSIDTPDLPHVGSENYDTVEIDLLSEELRDIPVTPEKKGKSSKVSGGGKDPGKGENTQLKVGSKDWDPVEVDLLLEELRDIPVAPEKKGKSSKVSGGGEDPGKGGNTQLKKNTSTTSYIKYLEPTRHNTDTCQTGLSKAVNLDVGSEDCDTVDIDLLLEELRDIPVTPEKKGKSNKVSGGVFFEKKKIMGKKSRQRQRHKQQQQQLPPQLEDPASLFPFCSWCGREDHRWRSCPDGPPADWCGRCEVDGHSWAGCPHNPDQEQLQTPSSAATPPLLKSPPSPPSQEIWDWLMHPEADLFHDLPIAINTLWRRDGGRWEKWEAKHHPASFAELALMVVNYLAVDMGDAPFKVELPSREPEREEPLPSREPEGEELPSR